METNVAIMMADLSGFTAMTEIHGDHSAISVIDKYLGIVKKSLVGSSHLHERVGDQMIIISSTVVDLAYTATMLFEHAHNENNFLELHAGLHFGKIILKDDDYFGTTINTAARITSVAGSGKILCSADFKDQLPENHPFIWVGKGKHKFKNLLNPVELFEMSCCIENMTKKYVIDPVCHMLIKSPETAKQFVHNEETLYFCSDNCLKKFMELNDIS